MLTSPVLRAIQASSSQRSRMLAALTRRSRDSWDSGVVVDALIAVEDEGPEGVGRCR